MHDPSAVRRCQCTAELEENRDRAGRRHRLIDGLRQGHPTELLHHQIDDLGIVVLAKVDEVDDVLVLEPARGASFTKESLRLLRIACEFVAKDFESDWLAKQEVAGVKDQRKATAAQKSLDQVTSSDLEWPRCRDRPVAATKRTSIRRCRAHWTDPQRADRRRIGGIDHGSKVITSMTS
jgi:hypothetical protein